MPIDPTVFAAGAIVLCMSVEGLIGRWTGRRLYHFADALSDVGSSAGQLLWMGLFGFTTVSMYSFLERHLALVDFPAGPLGWVLGFLLCEGVFYWRHRAGHEMALFWAIHEVHHQSSEYNLAVAQRVGWLQWAQTAVFVLPLALLGLPAPLFAALFAGIHFYQFLIHTKLVGTLGPLEHVLMTPSLHRVHHGRNPAYLDRNYAFTLSALDRLLGTLQRETEPVRYGTLTPLASYDPVRNNLDPWGTLLARMRAAPSAWTALQVPFRHPAWDPATGRVALPPRSAPACERLVPVERTDRRVVVLVATVLAVAATLVLVQFLGTLPTVARWGLGLGGLALTASVARLSGPLAPEPP